jgi:hypothetical protein
MILVYDTPHCDQSNYLDVWKCAEREKNTKSALFPMQLSLGVFNCWISAARTIRRLYTLGAV